MFVQEDLDTFPGITRVTSNVNSQNNQHQGTPPPTIRSNNPQPSRMNPITICSNGILKLLNNLKPGKANGPDGIPARFLRDFATSLTPSLTLLFQASLNQHKLPSDWKYARIVPIFKKGDCKSVTIKLSSDITDQHLL